MLALAPALLLTVTVQSGLLAPRRTAETPAGFDYEELVLADFDGDGVLDLAAGDRSDSVPGSSRIDVWLGDGTGAFQQGAAFTLGSHLDSLRGGDLEADGDVDLVWIEQSSFATGTYTLVHAMRGDGNGGFAAEVESHSGAKSFDQLELGDLNGDGRLDVLLANRDVDALFTSSFLPMLQHPIGAFAPGTPFDVLSERVRDFLLADLDGDGDLDVASVGLETLAVRHNQGGGVFAGGGNAFFPGLGNLEQLVYGRLLDPGTMVFGAVAPGGVHFASVSPAGTPVPLFVTQAFPRGPLKLDWSDADVIDADGDGRDEILVMPHAAAAFHETHAAYVSGTDAVDLRITAGWNTSSRIGDVDGDGLPDHVLVDRLNESFLVIFGEPGALALPEATVPDQWEPESLGGLAVGDFGLDGGIDFAAVEQPTTSTILLADSSLGFAELEAGPFSSGLDPVDFDGDGFADLVQTPGGNARVQVFLGDGSGGFGEPLEAPDVTSGTVDPRFLDVDLDGDLDLVHGRSGQALIRVHLGDGNGGLLPWSAGGGSFATRGIVYALDAGDVDADGAQDLVTANGWQQTYEVLLGDGAGGFASGALVPVPDAGAWGVRLVDLDSDLDLDLLLGLEGSLRVLAGDGAGAFTEIAAHAAHGVIEDFVVTDLDADGRLDLGAFAQGRLHLFRGTPAGFAFDRTVPTGVYPEDYAVLDVDADGRNDLVAASRGHLTVLAGLDAAQPGVATFGAGTGGCRGRLGVSASSPAAVGNAAFGLSCTNAPASTDGVFALGLTADPQGVPLLGVALHVVPAPPLVLVQAASDPGGTGWAALPIPDQGALAGKTVYGQFLWLGWPAAECKPTIFGLTTSVGVELTFQP